MERTSDLEDGGPEDLNSGRTDNLSPGRRTRKRSVYLFPAYGFSTALDFARRVEEGGGGTLSEDVLAVGLGLSVKGSGFRLKSLTARQFHLLNKQGDTLSSTPTAKSILRPTSHSEAVNGYRQAFMAIPLFRAVAERYRGQYLPDSQSLRNVLEREFQVDRGRVQQAEKLLMESARDTQVLTLSGDRAYLAVSGPSATAPNPVDPAPPLEVVAEPELEPTNGPVLSQASSAGPPVPNTLSFSIDEIAQLSDADFDVVWKAFGILVKSRRRWPTPEGDSVEASPDEDGAYSSGGG